MFTIVIINVDSSGVSLKHHFSSSNVWQALQLATDDSPFSVPIPGDRFTFSPANELSSQASDGDLARETTVLTYVLNHIGEPSIPLCQITSTAAKTFSGAVGRPLR
jgi:hypothetical protein